MLQITILSTLHLSYNHEPRALAPGSRAHALLIFLLLHHARPLERTYLAAQLEPDVPERTARRRLSDALYQLRQVLPATRFSGDPLSLSFTLAPGDQCDLLAFEQCLAQPVEQLEAHALLALPAPLLGPELDYEWLLPARENLHLRLLNALEQAAAMAAQRNEWANVRDLLQRLLQLEPMRDSAQPALLRAYEALGATNEGLRQYEQWRTRLQQEFALSPDPASERAYTALCHNPSPSALLPATLPLVGRDNERRQFMEWMDRTSGRPSLILLEGGPGIGKSHLLAHVADDARWRDWTVAQASATTLGSVIEQALQPLLTPLQYEQLAAHMPSVWFARLRMLFGWQGGGEEPKNRRTEEPKNRRTEEQKYRGAEDTPYMLPPYGEEPKNGRTEEQKYRGVEDNPYMLPPYGEEPKNRRTEEQKYRGAEDNPYMLPPYDASENEPHRYDELMLRLIEGLTEHTPLLLILDDLHAAADSTLALLPQLASLRPLQALVVIISYRSSVRDDPERWPLLQRLAPLASGRMRLAPFDENACALLLQQSLGPCSHDLIAQLHQSSGGYPLLLRETLHLLIEQNALQRGSDGRWRSIPSSLVVPQLHDLDQTISRRFAHLEADAQTLVNLIALHGQPLGVQQLANATNWPVQHVIQQAQGLIQRHLLRAEREGYSCSHDMIDQAICARLSPAEQRHYHHMLFQALAHAGNNAFNLGRHAYGAHLWASAIPYLLQAASELRARADYRAALRSIDQALHALDQAEAGGTQHKTWRSAALFERIQIWRWYPPPNPAAYRHDLETLAELLPATGLPRLQLAIAQINYLLDQGANQAALGQATTQLASLEAARAPALAAQLHCQAGKAAQHLGESATSIEHLRQAQALASASGAIATEVGALGNLAIYDHFAGNFSAARAGYNQVLQRCEAHGLIMDGLIANANLASLDHAQGQLGAALAGYERVVIRLERYAAIDPPDLENLAEICIQIGAFTRAEVLLNQARMLWAERNGSAALTHCRLITLALARQDLSRAESELATLQAQASDDQRAAGEAALWQSLIALEQGQWAAVEPLLDQAEAIYAQMGVRFYHALISAMRSLTAVRQGQAEAAQTALEQAEAAMAGRLPTFIDPRYLMGLSAESLSLAHQAAGYFTAAWQECSNHASTLSPELAAGLHAAPYTQRLWWATQRQQADPHRLTRLPLKHAPTGRPLHPWEEVNILWELPTKAPSANETDWRHNALRSLITQASHQEAAATLSALAEALGLSMATISRELHTLRERGELLDTRGAKRRGEI
ncbi:ATP-binding protein [Candidatus Viridilinea mediisalina]|uniref:Bacterial transcriptional activator domain-containing protein n=1 Tax=Candidatus Viridilinea mediisalina TaxID=2024553 RepID=A0A2A6RFN2_9CHLR|nr:AAA family ATPase [Candidatus Viridilinea mediisalina]PDW01753.1 hypothetical protein CJ255_17505 [Candidatus Viridilinea mediisalina]